MQPTILTDVPEDSLAVQEETFGPTLTVTKVKDVDEAIGPDQRHVVRPGRFGVLQATAAWSIARQLRSGMTSINSVQAFAGVPGLPFGGSGDSGFGRIHGEDGLREFTRAKSITRQRYALPMAIHELRPHREDRQAAGPVVRLIHGRR